MIRISNLSLPVGSDFQVLKKAAADHLHTKISDIRKLNIYKKSLDARKKERIREIYTVDVDVSNEKRYLNRSGISLAEYHPYLLPTLNRKTDEQPVVVGFGPAGMYAALILTGAGLKPIVLERGERAENRRNSVDAFWNGGPLNPESNVQFGEGGAGMFSDGKLNTGIHDGRIRFVLEQLIRFGAEEDILYTAKPHVGTDVLYRVIMNLRDYLIAHGADIRFETKLTDVIIENGRITGIEAQHDGDTERIPCSRLILAPGHSARDTFRMLFSKNIMMEPKAFSMGVRIEHSQKRINEAQYGEAGRSGMLPPADYKLSAHFPDGSSAYTFCMCPGGYVVAAASQENSVVTNGMSYRSRSGENANSALLVTLKPEQFPYPGTLGGLLWQEEIERRAFVLAGKTYRAPAQLSGDFLAGKKSTGLGSVQPTYRPNITLCDLHELFPKSITEVLEQAIPCFGRILSGFDDKDAVLTAPESRSSSPVRINRDENYQASVRGLFPAGEGAGYAGGIMSAACDGIRCAEALIADMNAELENE